jgi:hypothetical protein
VVLHVTVSKRAARRHWLARRQRVVHAAGDQWLRGPAPSDLKVIVVDIDRASIDALGTQPWPQETMARLVEAVATGWPLTRPRHGNCSAIAGTWGNGPVHHFPVSAGPFVPRSRVS